MENKYYGVYMGDDKDKSKLIAKFETEKEANDFRKENQDYNNQMWVYVITDKAQIGDSLVA